MPLNAMCSRRWATPLICAGSWRVPTATQTPIDTVSTDAMRSVRTRMPFSRVVRRTVIATSCVALTRLATNCWTAPMSFGRTSMRSARLIASARRGGGAGRKPTALFDRVGEFGGVRRGERDHRQRRIAPRRLGRGDGNGAVRVEQLAGAAPGGGDGGARFVIVDPVRGEEILRPRATGRCSRARCRCRGRRGRRRRSPRRRGRSARNRPARNCWKSECPCSG